MLKEWSLVAFTIAGQIAIGVFLFTAVPLIFSAGTTSDAVEHQAGLAVLAVVLGLLMAAAFFSFFHLHHPLRARRVLANIQTSWLSREVLFELVFMALVALSIVLVWRRTAASGFLKAVILAAALSGILFLLSMIRIYMLPTLPFWNRASTPLSFLLTSLALGSLAAGIVRAGGEGEAGYPGAFLLLSLIFIVADFASSVFITPRHSLLGHRSDPSLRPPGGGPRYLHLARPALLLAGLAVLGAILAAERKGIEARRSRDAWLVAVFALVLASQIAGRFLFYGLSARPRR